MKGTGVFATKVEIEHIITLLNLPVMYLSDGSRMCGDPIETCHRIALGHGLPEIPGYYGIKKDGEFVIE